MTGRAIGLGPAARCGAALLTAACLTLALPPADQGWLAWVALVPLLLACEGLGPGPAFALGLLGGIASALGVFHWLFHVPGLGWHQALILALYVGLYLAAWCGGLAFLARTRLPLLVGAPALWVALDYVRAHAGFLALPWGSLAHSQHRDLPVLQLATLTGEAGVTGLVVLGSAAVAEVLLDRAWRRALAAGVIIVLAHAGGALALARAADDPTLRVGLVQPSIRVGERRTGEGRAAVLARLDRLTRAAAATRPAFIAWPETAVGDLSRDPALIARLETLARAAQAPILVGASEVLKFAPREGEATGRVRTYNSAYLVSPGETIGPPYRKMRLVPFGEYVPLEDLVRWPAWLVPRVFEMTPGEERRQLALPDGTRLGVLICWENLFADAVRLAVQDGAHLLVQLTNDAWFGPTAAPRQHNLASVLRAVEHRIPVVIASNTGPSEVIDAYGRRRAELAGVFEEGAAAAEVSRAVGRTLYTRLGDTLVLGALVALGLGMAWRRGGRAFLAPGAGQPPARRANPLPEGSRSEGPEAPSPGRRGHPNPYSGRSTMRSILAALVMSLTAHVGLAAAQQPSAVNPPPAPTPNIQQPMAEVTRLIIYQDGRPASQAPAGSTVEVMCWYAFRPVAGVAQRLAWKGEIHLQRVGEPGHSLGFKGEVREGIHHVKLPVKLTAPGKVAVTCRLDPDGHLYHGDAQHPKAKLIVLPVTP